MAARKRSRIAEESDEDIEVDSPSSSFRQNVQKRSRVAMAAERGGSAVSDDEDYDVDALLRNESPDEDHVDSSPFGASEHEDDELDELLAGEMTNKNFSKRRDNIPSEQGVIEEVYCRNFMCHSKLRIKLGPLINFIIGHNGSGKSAVLTALQMCLGGKATATNRGASLKSLIKEGEEKSTLSVKIKNQGEGAYKPDLYGQSITVERHFTRSGTSSFKIRNSEDKTISTKKADLDDILDFFAFQLDNPINVLTQDLARQFLSNSSSAEKYRFFIRGTQLETLDNDYKILEEHLISMEEKLKQREDDIHILEDKSKEAEKRKKQLDDITLLQARIDKLQRMHAWLQVEEQEKLLQQYTDDITRAANHVLEKEQSAELVIGAFEGHDQAFEAARRTVSDLAEQVGPLQAQAADKKDKFEANKREIQGTMADQRRIKQSMDTCKQTITKLDEDILDERHRLSEAEGGAHAGRLAKLEELKAAARNAKLAEAEHTNEEPELDRARTRSTNQLAQAKTKRTEAAQKLTQAQDTLSQMERSLGRKYAGYHTNMEELIREIDRETRWRAKPVGPVGAHVRLMKPEWSSQIERMLGGTLEAFLVTCKDDQNILSSIMKRVRCTMTIFIGSPNALDTSATEPEPGVDTILRVLRIDNEFVRNTLITNHAVEQTVLIKNKPEAFSYMYENPRGRPRNVRAVIAQAPRVGFGTRFEFTSRGGGKTGSVKAWTGQGRMKTDREQQFRMQSESVAQASQELDSVEKHFTHCTNELQKAEQAIVRFKRDQAALRAKTQRAEENVEMTQNEIEGNQPQHGRIQELERQQDEARGHLQAEEASYQDSVLAIDHAREKGETLKAQLDAAQAEAQRASTRKADAEDRQQKLDAVRTKALHEKNEAAAKIETAKQHVSRLETKRDTQQNRVEEFSGKAEQISPRVPVDAGATVPMLDARLEKLEEDRKQRERSAGGTREELTEAWQVADAAYRDARGQMRSLSKVATALKRSLDERHRRWGLFRKYICVRARSNFTYLLSERDFRGRVEFKHANKQLEISVEPNLTEVSDAGRQARTLSGGEKSFSTICLLLSIWEAMGSPIRCLDEFDVFMDSVNRSTSMTMMIQAARRAVGRQFILITPQSMNQVELGDDVRIHRMSDPERGQTALPFDD